MINIIKKIIKFPLVITYSLLINFNIFFLKRILNYNIIYPKYFGFGDTLIFCIKEYNNLKKIKNLYIFTFGHTDFKVINYFFPKKKIIKSLFFLPKFFPEHEIGAKLRNFKNFCSHSVRTDNPIYNSNNIKKIILKLLKKNNVSKKLLFFKKKKYFLLFVKNYNNNKNDIIESASRQTTDFHKIYKIIKLLNDRNYTTIVLGLKSDIGTTKIKSILKNRKIDNIYFFSDFTDDYSLNDQIFICQNSLGYIGTTSGFIMLTTYLKKKAIIFDGLKDGMNELFDKKFIFLLYKKIQLNKKILILNGELIRNIFKYNLKKYKLIENSFAEIKLNIFKNLKT